MKAAPSRLTNRRSPRVVAMPSTPTRSTSGRKIASSVMMASKPAMQAKNAAVCQVQAIQANWSIVSSHPAEGEALGDVVADEPDHERTGHDGEHAGGGEQAPVHAGGGDRARHGGGDRLGLDGGERAREQQLDPRE